MTRPGKCPVMVRQLQRRRGPDSLGCYGDPYRACGSQRVELGREQFHRPTQHRRPDGSSGLVGLTKAPQAAPQRVVEHVVLAPS